MNKLSDFFTLFHFTKADQKNLVKILSVFCAASFILYGYYFFFSQFKLQLVYQNWDGPSYVVIAKSFYNTTIIDQVNTLRLPTEYFAAHFPLYPLLIRLFSFVGYFQSMILVSLLSTALYLCSFYFLAKEYTSRDNALILTLSNIFITPRWFIVSHVGSSEPLFLFLLVMLLLLIKKDKFILAAMVTVLLQLTRIQGVLIFGGIAVYYLYLLCSKTKPLKQVLREFTPFLLVPLAVLGLFVVYQIQFGNFWAFFEAQTFTNAASHLQFPPCKVLLEHTLPTMAVESWKELYLVYYLLIAYTVATLVKQKQLLLACIGLVYAIPLFFIVHIDLARYTIPLLPLFFIAFKEHFGSRTFLVSVLVLVPAIYLFAINFMNFNLSP